jgi:menaquinone-specific isochorismate synthase
MLKGRFIFEIAPNQVLLCEGPWSSASSDAEWEIAILPFKPLNEDSPSFLNARHVRIVRREDLSHSTIQPQLHWQTSARNEFTKSFQELKSLIQTRKAQKGVPWAYQVAHYPAALALWDQLLTKAQALSPDLTIYGAELAQESVLGASPEWLFRIDKGGRVLHTMALAGTRWHGQERGPQVEEKDRQEHQLVVDDICTRLKNFGQVERGACQWWRAGSVEHLRTPIKLVSPKPLDANEMVALLHPTPAVGVFPRTPEATRWLYELPGHERRADFGAPWVVKNNKDGRAWALVALRQVRLSDNEVFIPAGCGVVADSVDEVEWNEIQQKIQSVKLAWGLQG